MSISRELIHSISKKGCPPSQIAGELPVLSLSAGAYGGRVESAWSLAHSTISGPVRLSAVIATKSLYLCRRSTMTPYQVIDRKNIEAGLYLILAFLSKNTVFLSLYAICVITRCAETGLVPPANGVIVSAAALPAGFRTVSTELMTVVCTRAIPTI